MPLVVESGPGSEGRPVLPSPLTKSLITLSVLTMSPPLEYSHTLDYPKDFTIVINLEMLALERWITKVPVCEYSLVAQISFVLPGFHVAANSSLLHHGLCMNTWVATWPLMPSLSYCSIVQLLSLGEWAFWNSIEGSKFLVWSFTNLSCTSQKIGNRGPLSYSPFHDVEEDPQVLANQLCTKTLLL